MAAIEALIAAVRCPILIAHGTEDRCQPVARAERLAELTGAPFVRLDGVGHIVPGRHPVTTNLLIRDFIRSLPPEGSATMPTEMRWTRSLGRPKRALYISSPIGLGHAQRDVAIAAELRAIHPDLEIDWLAQHPVTAVLEGLGERIHPLSAELASESAHIAAESADHDLNAFQAIRRMDEILVANFMVFHDAVEGGEYDLVVGDEAWDVDHFFHENPELKRTAFAWMTDFVGWLPMPAGGDREAFLTADYNAEMIEHVERFPRVRDRAIFVGEPDDIVPDAFGPGLPSIREWTERHYQFSGYVTGFDPSPLTERRDELRRELGYHADERVVIVTVGGSGVGEALLRRVVAAFPAAARRVNGLRMIAVAGPRIHPASISAPRGVEVRGFVPRLYEHLAVCDLAVVQGGLTTTMELTAAGRPFLYFPLRNHFEQNRHVRHRLERYGAGRYMDYDTADPDAIAAAIAEEIERPVRYRPVEADGARRAAELIAPLL
jgi:predicted glycosyltransferase